VASFDPSADGVLLWTRVTGANEVVDLDYVIARDPDLRDVVMNGSAASDPEADHTAVADISGLDAGSTYFYAFSGSGATTSTARFRTIPRGSLDTIRLGIVCCSNHAYGYFAAYAAMASRNDIDAVLHLGDYIYEYGPGTFDDGDLPARAHTPPHEALTLQDYRTRYSQYRRDPDLQELHRQHSMFSIWDDHEFADNSYLDGANNHQPDEGDWSARRAAATQANFEWVPRRRRDNRIYRSVRMGDLADLVLLDTRMYGRDKQPLFVTASHDDGRQLLGVEQEAFVEETLRGSAADDMPWRIIGQQVMVAPLTLGGQVVNADQWDAYPTARARFLQLLDAFGDCVVLTGDIHSSWALDIPRDPALYDPLTGDGSVAVEFVSPGVTSPAVPGELGPIGGAVLEDLAKRLPHVRFSDIKRRGFVVVDIDRERVQADWYHFDDVTARDRKSHYVTGFLTRAGSRHLVPASGPLATRAGPKRAP
jgi:alkaline phosphatase D